MLKYTLLSNKWNLYDNWLLFYVTTQLPHIPTRSDIKVKANALHVVLTARVILGQAFSIYHWESNPQRGDNL